jgi:hemerythrin superfamily protein
MAKTRPAAKGSRKSIGPRTSRSAARSRAADAIALLKADHREVESWFAQFKKTGSASRKLELARKICAALNAHTTVEEEIFYPAFLEASDETKIHHEAEIEHAGAKKLIAQIEESSPDDDYYDAKVSVLSEMIKHHVKEEEKPGGMFAKARAADMDLKEIGTRIKARKQELKGDRSASERATMPMHAALR